MLRNIKKAKRVEVKSVKSRSDNIRNWLKVALPPAAIVGAALMAWFVARDIQGRIQDRNLTRANDIALVNILTENYVNVQDSVKHAAIPYLIKNIHDPILQLTISAMINNSPYIDETIKLQTTLAMTYGIFVIYDENDRYFAENIADSITSFFRKNGFKAISLPLSREWCLRQLGHLNSVTVLYPKGSEEYAKLVEQTLYMLSFSTISSFFDYGIMAKFPGIVSKEIGNLVEIESNTQMFNLPVSGFLEKVFTSRSHLIYVILPPRPHYCDIIDEDNELWRWFDVSDWVKDKTFVEVDPFVYRWQGEQGIFRLGSKCLVTTIDDSRNIVGVSLPIDTSVKIDNYENVTTVSIGDGGLPDDLKQFPNLNSLTICTRVENGSLSYLKKLVNLEYLSFSFITLDDSDLVYLEGLSNLKGLRIEKGNITDEGLVYIKSLSKLEDLSLPAFSTRHITDKGLSNLAELHDLHCLDLYDCGISDKELVALGNLTLLEVLILSHNNITDDGLKNLKNLRNLRVLDLDFTKITNTGLRYLKPLKNLQSLSICFTGVSNGGLKYLKSLKKLQNVEFAATEITYSEYLKTLPNCRPKW